MGGAFIREVDPRSIMFDPLCPDIGDGRAVFKFVPYPRAWFRQHYPDKEREMEADGLLLKPVRDSLLTVSDEDSIMLIECWLREYDPDTDRYSVRMLKLAGGVLLEDSARQRPEGYYAHGEYPFVVTALYPRRGSCLGFGLVDMFENQQLYSDKLDQIVLKNALMASHNKLLVTGRLRLRHRRPQGLVKGGTPGRKPQRRHMVLHRPPARLHTGLYPLHAKRHKGGVRRKRLLPGHGNRGRNCGLRHSRAAGDEQQAEPHGGQGHTRRIRAGSAPGDRGGEGVLHISEKGTPEEPHRYIAFQ